MQLDQVQTVGLPEGAVPSSSVGYSVAGQTILMMDPNQGVANGTIATSSLQNLPNGVQTLALQPVNAANSVAAVSSLKRFCVEKVIGNAVPEVHTTT